MVSARRIPLLVLAAAGLAVPAVASTDLPPGVDAGTATVASSSAATLQARVRPNDDDTTYAFELGTTDAYGYRSAEGSIDKNLTSRLVTARVSGLTAGTTYHFRVVAANRFGATQGPDATFATPGAAGQLASTPAVDPPTAPADTPAADAPGRPVADATAPGAPPAVLPEPAPLVAPPGPPLEAVPPAPEIGTAVVVAEAEGVVRWRDRA
ncbi:MAG: hypothetical protein HZB46_07460, partial [Solirubrobacterales bacterium]|nr:hypothetical protein [Solirubrobacterales bacterium]